MTTRRKIEVFSSGCPVCEETISLVKGLACSSCDVVVLDMHDVAVAKRANGIGVRTVPAVAVDGTLAACCTTGGPAESTLRAAGLGQPCKHR